MNFGLKPDTIESINDIFSKYGVIQKVVIYGSRAKGNFQPGSDIDLTMFGENLDLTTLSKIANQLDDLLLPYTIDLSLHSEISNDDLKDHIKRVGQVFYQK